MKQLRPYESPTLQPLTITALGKHQAFGVSVSSVFDEPLGIKPLLEEFGSPLFVVSEKVLRAQYRWFRDTFTASGADTCIAYSYKTNYLPAVCAALHQEGAWAEVVSGMEYELARELGVSGAQIVFNGPYKQPHELQRAVAEGAQINIDGFDELKAVSEVADSLGKPALVGVRFNFRHGESTWTKFGFNVENGDCQKALAQIARSKHLQLQGFHNHSGTFQVDPRIYGRAAAVMVQLAKRARDLGMKPRIADFGGGFPSSNQLKPHFDAPGGSIMHGNRLAPYAEIILNKICQAKELFGGRPQVTLEPGRAIVDEAVQLIATVVATKDIPGQGAAVVIDAGVNILPTAYWYDHEVDVAPDTRSLRSGMLQPVNIYGPMCMQIDVIRERVMLPPLWIGAPLVFTNVGAYCLTQSMQFIQPRPAVVMLTAHGTELIRRRETRADIFALDRVPKALRLRNHAV